MIRKPTFAGQFYPSGEKELRESIAECTPDIEEKVPAKGALSPHAGYVFSGKVAGAVFANIQIPPVALILNPSHHYYSPPFSLWAGNNWMTPLGEVTLQEELNSELGRLDLVTENNEAHIPEHAGEVILPFLQYHRPNIQICVLCVAASASEISFTQLGQDIAACLEKVGAENALVVASSDMSHEQGPNALEKVKKNDPLAIKSMEKLDATGLMKVCRDKNITMCGVLPASVMMETVKARGGEKGELISRASSADSPNGRGDYVVGYAGMVFT